MHTSFPYVASFPSSGAWEHTASSTHAEGIVLSASQPNTSHCRPPVIDLLLDGAGREQPVDGHLPLLSDPPRPLASLGQEGDT